MPNTNYSTLFKTCLVLALAVMLLFQFTTAADAKKIRFNIGFTTDQTLESPRASESWQYTEMGCAFWPVLYDQLWMMGPAPEYKALPALATRWETQDRQTWRFTFARMPSFTTASRLPLMMSNSPLPTFPKMYLPMMCRI
jgi:hypothetical protein